jgi:hypothetical protein
MNLELNRNLAQQRRLELLAHAEAHRRTKPQTEAGGRAIGNLLAWLRTGRLGVRKALRLQTDLG